MLTRGVIDTFDERAEQLQAAVEANGSEYEEIRVWVPNDPGPNGYASGGHWEVTGYDETKPLADRWLNNKAEKARFAKWMKAREGAA